jgi:hypothetical protein
LSYRLHQTDSRVGDLHYLGTTSAQRNADVAQRGPLEAEPRRLVVFGTPYITQFFLGRLLEPFDAEPVEVREHREHSNMELLQTKNRIDVKASIP